MTLIEEADEMVVIVSPYFKVKTWYKMQHTLNDLKSKNIEVEIYVREGEYEAVREVHDAGFEPIMIPNLHTKLYLNEKIGIVSSMNLLHSSDTNSLDIALKTESDKEYNDLWEYYLRYIKRASSHDGHTSHVIHATPVDQLKGPMLNLKDELIKHLSQSLGYRVDIQEESDCLKIAGQNRYEVFIMNRSSNQLRICGILSGKEYLYAMKRPGIILPKGQRIEYNDGSNGQYSTVWGIKDDLRSPNLQNVNREEFQTIADNIVVFMQSVEKLKSELRLNWSAV